MPGFAPKSGPKWVQNSGRLVEENNGQNEAKTDLRLIESQTVEAIDEKYGFQRINGEYGREEVGYLINMHATEVVDQDKRLLAAVDFYFIQEDGKRFKVYMPILPYFYIGCKSQEVVQETSAFLSKKYGGLIRELVNVRKEDLDLANHLVGIKQNYIKLSFLNMTDMQKVRKDLLAAYRRNRERMKNSSAYQELLANANNDSGAFIHKSNPLENISDIREYDLPLHLRCSIDKSVFVGTWYQVKCKGNDEEPEITKREDLIERPDCIVLAFDIETTKLPLKFPDPKLDQIMMISYMIDGQGYLITNREIISTDVEDFEYTPKPEFEGKLFADEVFFFKKNTTFNQELSI